MATAAYEIDGSTSREEIEAIIQSSAGYEYPEDLQKAWNYINALRAWLSLPVAEIDHAGERTRLDMPSAREQLAEARRWVAKYNATRALPVSYAPASDWRHA